MSSNHNLLPSDRVGIVGRINPISQSAATVTSGWVSMKDWRSILAILMVGALGASATVDAKLQQATDSSGSGAKDITGKAITQLTKAGSDDNKQVAINLRQNEMDFNNGFTHARLSVTVATADCLIAADILGLDKVAGIATDSDLATVDEVVS